jgi:fructoselysine-6-P-deglycase FrlB-like protein
LKTVEAFERDIHLQLEFLKNVKLQRPLAEPIQKRTIFCGTGDSLASAMLAEAFSDYVVTALDPLDAIKNKKLLKGKRTYFVSISGNTISNVRAARHARDSVAITRNDFSRLAKTCNGIIKLDYADSRVLTCGSVGFIASMLACVSLVRKIKIKNAKRLFDAAKTQSKKIALKNKIYVLGNQHTYPLTMYAAAKMYEALGIDAHYERIEQFSHTGLFSARCGDTVIIFEESPHVQRLAGHLKKLGLCVHIPSVESKSKLDQALFYAFVSQFVALYNAKRKRLSDCYFVTSKKIRNASSEMIY